MVDQDARYGEWLKHHLGVLCPESPVSVLQLNDFERWSQELSGRDCDVLMLAASFGTSPEDPKAQGLDLLRQLREKPHFPAVIAVAEEGNELTAVRAMQLGAVDYLAQAAAHTGAAEDIREAGAANDREARCPAAREPPTVDGR